MKEDQNRLLCLGVASVLRPNIELQAVLGCRVAVLSSEVLPYAQSRRLGKVRESAHGWLIGRAVTDARLVRIKYGPWRLTYADYFR